LRGLLGSSSACRSRPADPQRSHSTLDPRRGQAPQPPNSEAPVHQAPQRRLARQLPRSGHGYSPAP